MTKDMALQEIFYEIKPELREWDDLHGCRIIDDFGFDSVDIVEFLSKLEDVLGMDIDDMEEMLDIIQEYNKVEEWFGKRMMKG